MNSIRRNLLASIAVVALGLPASCAPAPRAEAPAAGRAPEPAAPGRNDSAPAPARAIEAPEPATLADAEALLERAREDLSQVLALNERDERAASSAHAGAPTPAPRSAPAADAAEPTPREEAKRATQAPVRAAEPEAATEPGAQGKGTCEIACRAFASLNRASDAVCRLDASDGRRCERARQIQRDAARRVSDCGCS